MFVDVVGDKEDSDWSLGNAVLIEVRETKLSSVSSPG